MNNQAKLLQSRRGVAQESLEEREGMRKILEEQALRKRFGVTSTAEELAFPLEHESCEHAAN